MNTKSMGIFVEVEVDEDSKVEGDEMKQPTTQRNKNDIWIWNFDILTVTIK